MELLPDDDGFRWSAVRGDLSDWKDSGRAHFPVAWQWVQRQVRNAVKMDAPAAAA